MLYYCSVPRTPAMYYDPFPHYLQTKHNNPIHNLCAHCERTLLLDVRPLPVWLLWSTDSNVMGGVKQILQSHDFRGVGEFCFGVWMRNFQWYQVTGNAGLTG